MNDSGKRKRRRSGREENVNGRHKEKNIVGWGKKN